MAFAFTFGSVGDIIAVGQIVTQIISALSDSRGSAVEYEQLFVELRSLQTTLDYLDKLAIRGGREVETLESIKLAAATCRRPLEAFQKKMEKYHRFLGNTIDSDTSDDRSTDHNAGNSWRVPCKSSLTNKLGSAGRKIQWEFTLKNEIQKLQIYLSVHIENINTLLAVYGLETMEFGTLANQERHEKLKDLINGTQRTLDRVSGNLDAQALVVKNTSNTVEKLFGAVMLWNAPLKMMEDLVSKICVSTQKIYGVLLEIKGSAVDIRWSFFQAPVLVEDAVGEKFPVPSEYDFSLLQGIILHRFQDGGQVSSIVRSGNYELSYVGNSTHVLSESVRLRPGSQVTMAAIIAQNEQIVACPLHSCRSREYQALQGGGFRCSLCNVWFDKSTQTTLQKIVEGEDDTSSQTTEKEQLEPNSRKRKNQYDIKPLGDNKKRASRRRLEDLRNIRVEQIHPNNYGNDLPCEFFYLGCQVIFRPVDFELWIEHTVSHFMGTPFPPTVICIFCDSSDAVFRSNGDAERNWRERMLHIRQHFYNFEPFDNAQPDFWVIEHMWRNKLICSSDYDAVMKSKLEFPSVARRYSLYCEARDAAYERKELAETPKSEKSTP